MKMLWILISFIFVKIIRKIISNYVITYIKFAFLNSIWKRGDNSSDSGGNATGDRRTAARIFELYSGLEEVIAKNTVVPKIEHDSIEFNDEGQSTYDTGQSMNKNAYTEWMSYVK